MAGRYPRNQWQSGIIASPYGPLNGARMTHFEDWLTIIVDDFDAHTSAVGDIHPQYLLEPTSPVVNGPVVWTGAGWSAALLTKNNIDPNAGILKSQLAPLQIVDGDILGPISKGHLDLAGQIGPADLAPSVGFVPSGICVDYVGTIAPSGWVLCDGSTYDGTNSTYLPLWQAMGSTPRFGGPGQSAFKVPDARGRVIVMLGSHTDVDTLGKNDGTVIGNRRPAHFHVHSLTLPNHVHSDPGHFHDSPVGNNAAGSAGGSVQPGSGNFATNTVGFLRSDTKSAGIGNPTANPAIPGAVGSIGGTTDAPSYLVLNKIIKL